MLKSIVSRFHRQQSGFLSLYMLFCIVLLVGIFFVTKNYLSEDTQKVVTSITPKPSSIEPVDEKHETYWSNKLGIAFNYKQFENTPSFLKISEVDNKINLHVSFKSKGSEDMLSKSIEVFEKDPSDTLQEALAKRFLSSYSTENCIVKEATLDRNYIMLNPSFEYARIEIAGLYSVKDFHDREEKAVLCPKTYTFTNNGMHYFVMDKGHPNRFAFVSLCHDNLLPLVNVSPGGPIISWDMTISFID